MFAKLVTRLLFGAALLFAVLQPASAETIELKVSHFLPTGHTMHKELVRWAEDLEKKSEGRLKLTIFPSSQMGPMPRQFDLARTGVADIAFSLHGGTPGRYPLTEVASLPFLVKTSAAASRALTELNDEYLAKEYEGLKSLYNIVVPPLNLNMAKKKIETVDDMKGLRIRHAGKIFAAVVTQLGATPVAVQPAESADALAKGIVDGALFPYEAALAFKLGDVCDYVIEPGMDAATFSLMMNPAKYASLPEDLRKLIDETTGPDAAERVGAEFDKADIAGRKYMSEKAEIVTLTPENLEKFGVALQPVTEAHLKELDGKGLPAHEFYDKFKAMAAK